jgi:hypothetical protein
MQIVTVTSLVLNFADACRALVPMLDGAAVPWGDEGQYDNWDRIAEALYGTLVTEPCALAALGEGNLSKLAIARYGFSPAPGDCNAYVAVEGVNPKRLVGLSTAKRPFDQVRVAGAEAAETMLLRGCRFIFVFPGPDGTQQRLTDLDLDA